ncbi:MAG: hypothetical protein WDA13_04660, partial [Candidatus Shapirobacteria bacterium]
MNLLQKIVKILIQIGHPIVWSIKSIFWLFKKISSFSLDFKLPRIKLVKIKLPKFRIKIPEFNLPKIKTPKLSFKLPKLSIKIAKINFKLPKLIIKLPKVKIRFPSFSFNKFNLRKKKKIRVNISKLEKKKISTSFKKK